MSILTNNTYRIFILLFLLTNAVPLRLAAQQELQETFNPIQTAVPIMSVAPDARSSGMGDMGVATTPDAYAQHWNAAKYPFIPQKMGVSLSYVPWLQGLVGDVNIAYLSFYTRVDAMQSASASLRYFSLGNMTITDEYGQPLADVSPYEFALDGAYSRRFGRWFAGALTLRYIRSDLTGGQGTIGGLSAANAFGADIAVYYQRPHHENQIALAGVIRNMGSKISYTENAEKYFMPATLHLGGRYMYNLNEENVLNVGIELSKLLVPTPPVVKDGKIIKGMDKNVGAVEGMFQSFYDAPYGMSEEMSEVMLHFGGEYVYNNQFAARAGYFHDSKRKGNRRYMTFGAGIKYSFLGLDVSYIYPFTTHDPLSNTLRISLTVDINTGRRSRPIEDEN